MANETPCPQRPCAECPWSKLTKPGQFSAERYVALRSTTGSPGKEAPIDAPIFACHKTNVGADMPCAGWLAAVGIESLKIRLMVIHKQIPAEALKPGPDWPPLYSSYAEMEQAMAGKADSGKTKKAKASRSEDARNNLLRKERKARPGTAG